MYRVAVSIVRDPALAEDVVQDALLKIWDARHTYRGDAPIRHWILRITHNTAVSTLRRIRDEAWDPSHLPESQAGDDVARTVEARDELERLRLALDQLDELSRTMVILREIEGLTYEQIADALGVTLALVKIRLFRARRTLAEVVRATDHANEEKV